MAHTLWLQMSLVNEWCTVSDFFSILRISDSLHSVCCVSDLNKLKTQTDCAFFTSAFHKFLSFQSQVQLTLTIFRIYRPVQQPIQGEQPGARLLLQEPDDGE